MRPIQQFQPLNLTEAREVYTVPRFERKKRAEGAERRSPVPLSVQRSSTPTTRTRSPTPTIHAPSNEPVNNMLRPWKGKGHWVWMDNAAQSSNKQSEVPGRASPSPDPMRPRRPARAMRKKRGKRSNRRIQLAKDRQNQTKDLRVSHGSKRVAVRENRGTATDNRWTYDTEEVCDIYFKANQQRRRGQKVKAKGKQANGANLLLDLDDNEEVLYQRAKNAPNPKQQVEDDDLVTEDLEAWADQQLDQQIIQSHKQSDPRESPLDQMRTNFVQSVSSISEILQGPQMSQPIVDLLLQHLAYCVQTYTSDGEVNAFDAAFLQQYVWSAHPDFQQTWEQHLCTCVQGSQCPLFDQREGNYQFANLHFQEYLCACYIVHATPGRFTNLEAFAEKVMQQNLLNNIRHLPVVWMIRELLSDDTSRAGQVANRFLPDAKKGTLRIESGLQSGKAATTFFSLVSALHTKVKIDLSQSGLTSIGLAAFQLVTQRRSFEMVLELNLSGNSINGKLPDLSRCSNLKVLIANSSEITGTLSKLSACSRLEKVSLACNRISGKVPSFEGCCNLQYLNLAGNLCGGPIPWGMFYELVQFQSLKHLNLSNNKFRVDSLPNSVAKLTNLQALALNGLGYKGRIPSFERCVNLQYLNLGDNDLTGKGKFKQLMSRMLPDCSIFV